jgi:hypothetical protein
MVLVTAVDANEVPVFSYSGSIRLASSDPDGIVPPAGSLSDGAGTFPMLLKATGNQTITVFDAANPAIRGASPQIVVISE